MSDNIHHWKILEIENLSFKLLDLFHLGEYELRTKGTASSVKLNAGYGLDFNVTDIEIYDVGSSRAWKEFKENICPIMTGKLSMSVMFESGDIEGVDVDNGEVRICSRQWWEDDWEFEE